MTAAIGIAAALLVSTLLALVLTRRSGTLRTDDAGVQAPAGLDLCTDGPTIVHFTAVWCGPCAAVRRVVNQVIEQMQAQQYQVGHVEVDIDANPEAAKQLSVLSLPTTFIFDGDGRQVYRIAGVPKSADLCNALQDMR